MNKIIHHFPKYSAGKSFNCIFTFKVKSMAKVKPIAMFAIIAMSISACGTQPGERVLSGISIGAAAGALINAASGGTAASGALIGGVVGGIGGAVTDPDQIDFGNPFGGF